MTHDELQNNSSDTGTKVGPEIHLGCNSFWVFAGKSSIDKVLLEKVTLPSLFTLRILFNNSILGLPSALEKVFKTSI